MLPPITVRLVPVAEVLHALTTAQPLLKATTKKQVHIPGYTKADGTFVAPHQAWVHVADDHDEAKLLAGNGTFSQKQAHAQIAGQPWFQALPAEHKATVLMAFAALPYEQQFAIAASGGDNSVPNVATALSSSDAAVAAPAPSQAPAAAPTQPVDAAPAVTGPLHEGVKLTNTTAGHNKWWSARIVGSVLETRWGAIGAKGQQKFSTFVSPDAAAAAAIKLINQKLGNGYKNTGHAPSDVELTQKPAPKQPAAPAHEKPTADNLGEIDGWEQTGPQTGSNPGGRFKDPATGQEWYCKFPASAAQASNEILAAKLYAAAGVKVPEVSAVMRHGKMGVASKWMDGVHKAQPSTLAKADGAYGGFAVDAWLANWDAVGLVIDNLLIDKTGAAVRIDVGGSLLYRAQGSPKGDGFGTAVPELDTLRGKSIDASKNNTQAASVFGGMTNHQVGKSIGKVLAVSDATIDALCDEYGPGSKAQRAALAKKLIARKQYLAGWIQTAAPGVVPAKPAAVVGAKEIVPKDGDTKRGADGTLVFKDGRWHKQEQALEAPPSAADMGSFKDPQKSASVLSAIHAAASNGELPAGFLKKTTVSGAPGWLAFAPNDGTFAIKATPSSAGGKAALAWLLKVKAHVDGQAAAPAVADAPVAAPTAAPTSPPASPGQDNRAVLSVIQAVSAALLPTSNTNHGPANKKLKAISYALATGNLASLQAMTFGSNTYGQKAKKIAQQAMAALGGVSAGKPEGQPPSAEVAAKAPAAVVGAKEKAKAKPRFDETKLPVDPSALPPLHDFLNWNLPGKGLSSSGPVNAANLADEKALLDFAKTGNLVALKNYKYQAINKETGDQLGLKPIDQHPSQHVKLFHSDLVAYLDAIAHPPKPLEVVNAKAGSIEELANSAGWEKLGVTATTAKGEKRLGFFIALAKAADPHKFAPTKTMPVTAAAKAAAVAGFKKLSSLARHFIARVQSSGTYNDYFRNGAEIDGHGYKTAAVAAAAYDAATEMPEGTSIYRWMNMPPSMVKQLMAAPDGLIFQNPGSMCCSMSETATQGFGEHRLVIRYAKGAKAVNSFASGRYGSEQEITALPGARFMVLKKEMVSGKYSGQRLELELLMLPPDPGYVADLQARSGTMAKALVVVGAREVVHG